jgi:para-nitrobenzyl esterase
MSFAPPPGNVCEYEGPLGFLCDFPGSIGECHRALSFAQPAGSEDCLKLNIFAPIDSDEKSNLPVVVFFHGGSYLYSSPSAFLHDGTKLAGRGIVVVTVAYRLGALGFLASPDRLNLTGNYGILDQIESLRWVKTHIRQFGGNPEQVTIMGESAGGTTIAILLTTPKTKGLFQRAIIESAPLAIPFHANSLSSLTIDDFMASVNCTDLMCLRTIDVKRLLQAQTDASSSAMSSISSFMRFLEKSQPYMFSWGQCNLCLD